MRTSINCSAVICPPTVIYAILREALVKPMAPGSTLLHRSFRSTIIVYYLFCNLYFSIYTTKIPKIFIFLSLSDLTFASYCEGIDNPFYRIGCEVLVCLCRCEGLVRRLLLDWYLGSQKLRENTYATLLHHLLVFKGKPTQCSTLEKNTLPWWYVFVTVGCVFCHACTSMKNLWQNQDSPTCAIIEVFHDVTKIIITEVSTSMTINRASQKCFRQGDRHVASTVTERR